jgi:peroxiredoxin
MARTPSTMLALGTPLPAFSLPEVTTGQNVTDASVRGYITVIAFICNHCPFVIHLKKDLAAFGRFCQSEGVRMLAISSNDVATHPMDGPDAMAEDAKANGYVFPYLYDETQDVAHAFDAACTPDFFVFDEQGLLAYRGQFDSSRPGNGVAVTGEDLYAAVQALLAGRKPSSEQKPSIGCNIKWKAA